MLSLEPRSRSAGKAHGWSRKYLMVECRRTGGDLLYSEIVRIEQGKVLPRTRTIVQIAAALGVQPYELLSVNGSKPAQAVSLLLSGCACYHTESPARIFTDASGEVRVVPNPDYERSKRWVPITGGEGTSAATCHQSGDTIRDVTR